MRANSVVYLIIHSLMGDLTEAERLQLEGWLEDARNRAFYEEMTQSEHVRSKVLRLEGVDKEKARKRLEMDLKRRSERHKIKRLWGLVAGMSVILGVGGSILLSTKNVKNGHEEPVGGTLVGTLPVIRLASGEEVCLEQDSAYCWNDGFLEQGDGYARYKEPSKVKTTEAALKYHEVRVPKGSEYRMMLPDGTKVCLNAGSMLRFPVNFAANERRVVCDGELFFDVARDSLRPFFVETAGNVIKVLGTSFDIRHYEGEPYRAVLLSGSIHLSRGGETVLLNPGEQARLMEERWIVEKADATAVSWVDGYFIFDNCSLGYIMKELARWYDIEVFYADSRKEEEHYSFEIERSSTLKQVMEILRKTRTLDVEINGRTVIIR